MSSELRALLRRFTQGGRVEAVVLRPARDAAAVLVGDPVRVGGAPDIAGSSRFSDDTHG